MQIIGLDDPTSLETALRVLRAGGLVVCPTETVYGVLADVTNAAAITKLLTYKRRPAGKAISIAVASPEMADRYVTRNDQARALYATLLPGPVTVVSTSTHTADQRLESEFGTIGIRWPDHTFLQNLITAFDRGVTATSANSAGRKTPYRVSDLLAHLSDKQKNLLDLIIDAGTLPKNPPSLVIDTTPSTPIVMRSRPGLEHLAPPDATYRTRSDEQTRTLAGQLLTAHLDTLAHQGLVITLDGDLGAGKTTFTQGLARALGITQTVNSPTYTYLKQYPYTKYGQHGVLHHLDVWTIDQPQMLAALQLHSLLGPGQLVVIEWWSQIQKLLPDLPARLEITLTSPQPETDVREICVHDYTKNN